ncbi:MAG: hypothetical protein AB1921_08025 [Thermodesulfobacteriota bacterium]
MATWLVILWGRVLAAPQKGLFACLGCITGLVLITKAEAILAAGVASLLGWCFVFHFHRSSWRRLPGWAGTYAASSLGVLLLTMLLLAVPLGLGGACKALWFGWIANFSGKGLEVPFYDNVMGVDRPIENLFTMLVSLLGCCCILAAALSLDLGLFGNRKERRPAWLLGAVLFAIVAALQKSWTFPLLVKGGPLPFICAAALVAFTRMALSKSSSRAEAHANAGLALWSAFSLFLLAKILLNPLVFMFGFALAVPATLLFACLLIQYLPKASGRLGNGRLLRFLVLALLVADACFYVKISADNLAKKTFPVGRGKDIIITRPDFYTSGPGGRQIQALLNVIEASVKPGETLLVLPEGIIINYLSRTINPTPYMNFMPTEMLLFGEDKVLEAIRAAKPDFIAYVPKNPAAFGTGWFGEDPNYGKEIMDWVKGSYKSVWQLADPRLPGPQYTLVLYQAIPFSPVFLEKRS